MSPDFEEFGVLLYFYKLISEIFLVVSWELSFKCFSGFEDKFEREFRVSNYFTILTVFGVVWKTEMLDVGSYSTEFTSNRFRWDSNMITEITAEEIPWFLNCSQGY